MMRRVLLAASICVASLAGGCEVEPYCLTCRDGAVVEDDAGFDASSGFDGDIVLEDAGEPVDAGPDACVDTEACNDIDDDCDGFTDEGFDLETNPENCGECGNFCIFPHAFAMCASGECAMGDCDVGFYDLNEDQSDGCEYNCPGTATDDAVCNLRDDDCDGTVDEDVDKQNDPVNCGVCGRVCNFPHAAASCVTGACSLGDCDAGFHDLDGRAENGCEYACTPSGSGVEECNARDDDCDGTVDEGDPGGGESCGSDVGACQAGTTACEAGRIVCNGSVRPTTEVCNGTAALGDDADDDCDGNVDEGNPDGGRVCGTSVGLCEIGAEQCVDGVLVCMGQVDPVAEVCDGLDQDCDGVADNGNPRDAAGVGGGDTCGSDVGACNPGALYCGPQVVGTCSGSGAACSPAAPCPSGQTCDGFLPRTGGVPVCVNPRNIDPASTAPTYRVPRAEVCNGTAAMGDAADDDCDGTVDEGNPGGGATCGTDVGICSTGTQSCVDGVQVCTGNVSGMPNEICNGQDDDCDGNVDEGNPRDAGGRGGGDQCGDGTGLCDFGSLDCVTGVVICQGATGPTTDVCDGVDNDCDGDSDEDFDFANDLNNCGGCGVECVSDGADCSAGATSCVVIPNSQPRCGATGCLIESCDGGFVDLDGNPSNGCEYACDFRGSTDVCNGRDDDCDGTVDEDASPPAGLCDNDGVCSGTTATCGVRSDGSTGFVCNYGAGYEESERSCDGADNDCDGRVDESHPLVGTTCFDDAIGSCRRTGENVCDAGAPTGPVTCQFSVGPIAGVQETCNGQDDDCDGFADEAGPAGVGAGFGIDASALDTVTVTLRDGVTTMEIMSYEASRPDATSMSGGQLDTDSGLTLENGSVRNAVACSRPNVRPWVNVDWQEAMAACCNLNADGTCPDLGAGEGGWTLCGSDEWQDACEGPTDPGCQWSYQSSCESSQPTTCNGAEVDSDPGRPGDQDAIANTGAFAMCHTDWGAAGDLYDMSGNVREWTADVVSGNCATDPANCLVQMRGGSFNAIEAGRSCQWTFTVAQGSTTAPNTGFRCCNYPSM